MLVNFKYSSKPEEYIAKYILLVLKLSNAQESNIVESSVGLTYLRENVLYLSFDLQLLT